MPTSNALTGRCAGLSSPGVDSSGEISIAGRPLELPVVGAPMAGGPSTPALAAAVSDAGGLGFLAAGYKEVDAVRAEIAEARTLTARPFGVNLFVPGPPDVDDEALRRYAARLEPEARRLGVRLGDPVWSDDGWQSKVELVLAERPAVVSFTFGCPPAELVSALRGAGVASWCSVTSTDEARQAAAAGVDALVVQGAEAGGHRGSFLDDGSEAREIRPLLAEVAATVDLPLVAAGGVGDGRTLAAVLEAGAAAAQVGTALLLCPEAGTGELHRQAILRGGPTAHTRAFTGRTARALVNRFLRDHGEAAPAAYPHVHRLTAPLRAAARDAGDADTLSLWAGTRADLARAVPAGVFVRRWAETIGA